MVCGYCPDLVYHLGYLIFRKSLIPCILHEAQPDPLQKELQTIEEVSITCNQQPVAKLVGPQRSIRKARRPGSAKDKLVILAEDDEHL